MIPRSRRHLAHSSAPTPEQAPLTSLGRPSGVKRRLSLAILLIRRRRRAFASCLRRRRAADCFLWAPGDGVAWRRLQQYRKDARLTNRMPGYKVQMGFGLHVGWAIEGAIGSKFKVDASYLSPNVNLTARLEVGTAAPLPVNPSRACLHNDINRYGMIRGFLCSFLQCV